MKKKSNNKSQKQPRFIVYFNEEEAFITTPAEEDGLRGQLIEWNHNLDPDDGDFERIEMSDTCVHIESRRGWNIE